MRPVRPIRCTCVSILLATSKLTTFFTSFTSRPRDATSVATRMRHSPVLNLFNASVRSCWVLSPCKQNERKFMVFRFFASSSHPTLLLAKINTRPSSAIAFRFAMSQGHLARSFCRTTAICRISSLAWPIWPIVIFTGLLSTSSARASMRRRNVAENMSVCLSGRIWPMIERSCGSKPISNIRSASSSTTKVTRFILAVFLRIISINRPGVATTTSAPLRRACVCSHLPTPP